MGKKKHQPQRKWKHRRVRKSTFLAAVRQRLLNDIEPYVAAVREVYRRTGKGVGFWALARMVFLVVEAVSSIVYKAGTRERQPVRLLRELGFEYPNLVWEMYRHTLMHNDEMASASYRGRTVAWGIRIRSGHSWSKGRLHIDAEKLYKDLVDYLARESSHPRNSGVHIWVKESFRFNTGFSRATRDEALRLGST